MLKECLQEFKCFVRRFNCNLFETFLNWIQRVLSYHNNDGFRSYFFRPGCVAESVDGFAEVRFGWRDASNLEKNYELPFFSPRGEIFLPLTSLHFLPRSLRAISSISNLYKECVQTFSSNRSRKQCNNLKEEKCEPAERTPFLPPEKFLVTRITFSFATAENVTERCFLSLKGISQETEMTETHPLEWM